MKQFQALGQHTTDQKGDPFSRGGPHNFKIIDPLGAPKFKIFGAGSPRILKFWGRGDPNKGGTHSHMTPVQAYTMDKEIELAFFLRTDGSLHCST